MTIVQPATPVFGRELAVASRAAQGLLLDLLATAGITFDEYIVMRFVTAHGPEIAREDVCRDVAEDLRTDESVISDLLDRMEAAGDVGLTAKAASSHGRAVSLTEDGDVKFRRLSESIQGITARLVGPLDPTDLETTRRVLRQVTERAQAMRAGQF